MSELMMWQRVPKGTTLNIRIDTTEGQCVASGEWVTHIMAGGETTELWQDADFQPDGKDVKLRVPDDYTGFIRVTFPGTKPSRAEVTARIFKSDGSPFGEPRTEVVSGKKGDDPRLVTLVVRMRDR